MDWLHSNLNILLLTLADWVTVQTSSLIKSAPAAVAPTLGIGNNLIPWIVVGVLAVLVIVMLCLIIVLLKRSKSAPAKQQPSSNSTDTGDEEPQADPVPLVAYLEPTEDGEVAYAITTTAYRIGRHSSNDLPISDPSVSRQHAEIRRRGSGFTISDLNSMNGVFVNNKQQKHSALEDNDAVELGDVAFRFKLETTRAVAGDDSPAPLDETPTEFKFDLALDSDEDDKERTA